MKTILILIVLWIGTGITYAQLGAGKVYVSGTVLLTREATNPASAASFAQQRTQLTLAPQLGLFVSNLTSLEVGLNSTIVWKRTQNPNLPLNLQREWGSSFGVSLGMRFYFKNENEKFKFFLLYPAFFLLNKFLFISIKISKSVFNNHFEYVF